MVSSKTLKKNEVNVYADMQGCIASQDIWMGARGEQSAKQ